MPLKKPQGLCLPGSMLHCTPYRFSDSKLSDTGLPCPASSAHTSHAHVQPARRCGFSLEPVSASSLTGAFSIWGFKLSAYGISEPRSADAVSAEAVRAVSPQTAVSSACDRVRRHRQIGQGASSKVYLTTHTESGKLVAVKVLQNVLEGCAKNRQLLLNELQMAHGVRRQVSQVSRISRVSQVTSVSQFT